MTAHEVFTWMKGFVAGAMGLNYIYINNHKVTYHDQARELWVISVNDGPLYRMNPVNGMLFDIWGQPLNRHSEELVGLR